MFRFSHLYILASEHNRIASQLKIKLENEMFFQSLSLREQDECIYQETRRIVIAEVSCIIILINNQIDIFSSVSEHCLPRVSASCSWSKDDGRLPA